MIIGLSGYARSGKDTVAEYLVEHYGYTRVAFADAVRNYAYEINPLIDNAIRLAEVVDDYGWDVAKQNLEIRRTLQQVGVAARNQFGDLFWVNMALDKVSYTGDYVITDVRFKNEASHIKRRDYAQVWRIERPGVGPINNHISEVDMDDWEYDFTFVNSGTLEDLALSVRTRLQHV